MRGVFAHVRLPLVCICGFFYICAAFGGRTGSSTIDAHTINCKGVPLLDSGLLPLVHGLLTACSSATLRMM